jgi:nucleoside-diphosphate-sugar epimerase
LRFVPFAEYEQLTEPEHAQTTWEHISRSPSASTAKARRLLGYAPRYTSLQAVAEAVQWLQGEGQLDLGPAALTS